MRDYRIRKKLFRLAIGDQFEERFWIEKRWLFLWIPINNWDYNGHPYFRSQEDAESYLENYIISKGAISDVKYLKK